MSRGFIKNSYFFIFPFAKCGFGRDFRTLLCKVCVAVNLCTARQRPRLPLRREARRLPPHATELQRCEPRLSPPTAGCPHPSRRSAKEQHRATFPKGKARAAAAAERRYCRRSSAAGGAKAVFPKGKGFSPHKFAVFVAPGRVFCYNTFNNTQNAQKGLFV